jgi:outer membrane protein OmpA-like peptidoglycan-associated protein
MRIKSLFLLVVGFGLTNKANADKDTVSVYFRTSESSMTEGVRQQLDRAIYDGVISDRDELWLIGYADEVGGSKENLRLSKARAGTIKKYLIQSGFMGGRITLVSGKGESGASTAFGAEGNPHDRRVDIVRGPISAHAIVTTVPATEPIAAAIAIDVSKVAAGQSLKLDRIYFVHGTHSIKSESQSALEALHQSLNVNPKVRVRIEGHVCCQADGMDGVDGQTMTQNLSVNRARAVRDYLVEKGISADRLEYEGFARRRPIYEVEENEEQMQANRRVEIRILN